MNDDFQVQQQLLSELDAGEKIIWQGVPKRRLAIMNLLPVLFVLLWFGFVSTMVFFGNGSSSVHRRSSLPVAVFFPLIGIIFVVAVPLLRFFTLSRTYYLLTNRRALIITLGSSRKVLSYYPDRLQALERRERKDGWGDLIIDKTMPSGYRTNMVQPIGFMNITDVKRVESLVRGLVTTSEK